jgi:hypothetical protein
MAESAGSSGSACVGVGGGWVGGCGQLLAVAVSDMILRGVACRQSIAEQLLLFLLPVQGGSDVPGSRGHMTHALSQTATVCCAGVS